VPISVEIPIDVRTTTDFSSAEIDLGFGRSAHGAKCASPDESKVVLENGANHGGGDVKTSVLIVDSLQLVREGLRAILAAQPGLEVTGEAADGRGAVAFAREHHPDVVVLEEQLRRLSSAETVRRIREESPTTACIVLSGVEGDSQVRQALLSGATGFVPKSSSSAELLDAIRAVARGRSYLAPALADHVVSALRATGRGTAGPEGELTNRQREVLQLIAEGLSTKEIAEELGISVKTAQTHRAKLMGRVGIRKASSLVRYAIREGIVSA
jgi:DNA-binding NarL/FixJ family response regulator